MQYGYDEYFSIALKLTSLIQILNSHKNICSDATTACYSIWIMTLKAIFMRGICVKEVKHHMEYLCDDQNKTYENVRIKAVLLEKKNAADQAERKMIVKQVKSELERTMMALSTQVQQLHHSLASKA